MCAVKDAKRFAALCLAVIIAFTVAFSALYIAHNSDHECSGQSCVICAALRACGELFGSLGTALGAVCLFASVFSRGTGMTFTGAGLFAGRSPVSLRVKLIN